ncbi:MAG: hypothetical protein ACREOI_03120 [bacterium]
MRTSRTLILTLNLFCFSSVSSFAQNGKLSFGVDYNSSPVKYQPLYAYLGNDRHLDFDGAISPQNLRGRVELGLNKNLTARLTAGHGGIREKHYGFDPQNDAAGTMAVINSEVQFTASGNAVEIAVLHRLPFRFRSDPYRWINLHFGAGLAYYLYRFDAEGFWELKFFAPEPGEHHDLIFPSAKYTSLSQFFVAAVEFRPVSSIAAMFEMTVTGPFNWSKISKPSQSGTFAGGVDAGGLKRYRENISVANLGFAVGITWSPIWRNSRMQQSYP